LREVDGSTSWIVYLMAIHNGPPRNAVCEQGEWDEIERRRPGNHTLLRSGLTSECEAERLARGTSGDARPRKLTR
jgi:hypothetical protein